MSEAARRAGVSVLLVDDEEVIWELARVVLLDHQMPGLSGLEVAAELLDADIIRRARLLGIAACVPEPDVTKLPGILDQLLAAS